MLRIDRVDETDNSTPLRLTKTALARGRIVVFALAHYPRSVTRIAKTTVLQDMPGSPPVLRLYPTRRRRSGGVDLHPAERSPSCQPCPQRDGSPFHHKLLSVCGGVKEVQENRPFGARERERNVWPGENTRKTTGLNVGVFVVVATLKSSSFGALMCLASSGGASVEDTPSEFSD